MAIKDSIILPNIPSYATNNAHMFYIVTENLEHRTQLISTLKDNGFHAVFHYISLHSSEFYNKKHDGRSLMNSDKFTDCLIRLPLYFELNNEDVLKIIPNIN